MRGPRSGRERGCRDARSVAPDCRRSRAGGCREAAAAPRSRCCRAEASRPGAEPAAARDDRESVPCSTAKIVEPSVLTMSGSSTPGSWLLVVEKEVPPPALSVVAPAGAGTLLTEGRGPPAVGPGRASGVPLVPGLASGRDASARSERVARMTRTRAGVPERRPGPMRCRHEAERNRERQGQGTRRAHGRKATRPAKRRCGYLDNYAHRGAHPAPAIAAPAQPQPPASARRRR